MQIALIRVESLKETLGMYATQVMVWTTHDSEDISRTAPDSGLRKLEGVAQFLAHLEIRFDALLSVIQNSFIDGPLTGFT